MAQRMSADEAAALFEPRDTFAMPLGPGQPASLLEALGKRDDWEELRIGTALLFVLSPLFNHPGVHYLSGFFGPIERALRDSGANISFAPADFRRFAPILEDQRPRMMATAATPPDARGGAGRRGGVGSGGGPGDVSPRHPARLEGVNDPLQEQNLTKKEKHE